VAELLVEDLAARDGQSQEPVTPAVTRVQADHAGGAGAVDGRELAARQQMAPDLGEGIHRPVGAVREAGEHVARPGADLGDVAHFGAVDPGEVAADINVRAFAAAEGDGADRGRTILVGLGAAHHPGAHDVTVYGLRALKLKMSVRAYVLLPCLIELKLPTAYITPPHLASWRICSLGWDELARRGVLLAGVGDTTPAGGRSPPVPAWAAAMPSVSSPAAADTAVATMSLRTTGPPFLLFAQLNHTAH
jgi:hypothetical protein